MIILPTPENVKRHTTGQQRPILNCSLPLRLTVDSGTPCHPARSSTVSRSWSEQLKIPSSLAGGVGLSYSPSWLAWRPNTVRSPWSLLSASRSWQGPTRSSMTLHQPFLSFIALLPLTAATPARRIYPISPLQPPPAPLTPSRYPEILWTYTWRKAELNIFWPCTDSRTKPFSVRQFPTVLWGGLFSTRA